MTRYVIANTTTGEILRIAECESFAQAAVQNLAGEVTIEDATATAATHYYVPSALVAYSGPEAAAKAARPDGDYVWDNTAMAWEDQRTLAQAKIDQTAIILRASGTAEYAGFTWSGDTFASDSDSQRRINTAMLSAVVAQRDATAMSIDWPLANGTYRTLDEDDLVALGQALYAHIAAVIATEKAAYDAIAAATTIPDVVSVGWPP